MKKTIFSLATIAVLSFSAHVNAATIDTGEPITNAECELLGETVRLNLSANVFGAYSCDVATSRILIATCHQGGSRNERTVVCENSGTAEDPVWNAPGCSAGESVSFADFRGFRGSNLGGRIAEAALGGNCTQAAVEALVNP